MGGCWPAGSLPARCSCWIRIKAVNLPSCRVTGHGLSVSPRRRVAGHCRRRVPVACLGFAPAPPGAGRAASRLGSTALPASARHHPVTAAARRSDHRIGRSSAAPPSFRTSTGPTFAVPPPADGLAREAPEVGTPHPHRPRSAVSCLDSLLMSFSAVPRGAHGAATLTATSAIDLRRWKITRRVILFTPGISHVVGKALPPGAGCENELSTENRRAAPQNERANHKPNYLLISKAVHSRVGIWCRNSTPPAHAPTEPDTNSAL